MKKLFLILTLIVHGFSLFAQSDYLVKDLQCYEPSAYAAFDLLSTTREYGEYEPMAIWSRKISSGDIVEKFYPLEGGIQYAIILATEDGVDATAMEIRDKEGNQVEYLFKINELNNNQINFFYTPSRDDTYRFYFRVMNRQKSSSCLYMTILKGGVNIEEDY